MSDCYSFYFRFKVTCNTLFRGYFRARGCLLSVREDRSAQTYSLVYLLSIRSCTYRNYRQVYMPQQDDLHPLYVRSSVCPSTSCWLVGLILIATLLKNSADIILHIFMYGCSLFDELLRCPPGNSAMLRSEMIRVYRIAVVMTVTSMMRNQVVVVIDLYIRGCIVQLHFLANKGVWQTVIVDILVESYVAIIVDCGNDVLLYLKGSKDLVHPAPHPQSSCDESSCGVQGYGCCGAPEPSKSQS